MLKVKREREIEKRNKREIPNRRNTASRTRSFLKPFNFRAQGSEAYAKNASAGLLNAYSRTLALSCKVLWVVAMASEGGGEDGARGVHEVRGTAQRVEAKGEAARETVEEGARGEGRGHGASATRCYKGGYAAKSPQ